MNSTKARDKAISLMNEEGKEVTVDFLVQQLEIEDCNSHHMSLSQFYSTPSVNFVLYDHRQNKRVKNKKNMGNRKWQAQNKSGEQRSSGSGHQSRKPPGMKDKCMRCGKYEHQPGQRCPAKNAKCKECHKIGHFYKVCQSKKRATQWIALIQDHQEDPDTNTDELGSRQPNPPRVNMIKVVNHTDANRETFNEGKHLKFPIASHPSGPYNHHLLVSADVNCMNENTQWTFSWSETFCMPLWDTEFWILNCKHFYTGTVLYLLTVLGRKVPEHFHSHRCQWLPKSTQSWSNFQDGCIAAKLPQKHGGGRRKCDSFQQNESWQNERTNWSI